MGAIIKRLTTALEVVNHWDYINTAILDLKLRYKEPLNAEQMFATLCWLATTPLKGWIGVAYSDEKPSAFVALQELITHDNRKTFQVLLYWHSKDIPNSSKQTLPLMTEFETWALSQGIKKYQVSTRRDSGAAIRCFQSAEYGFKRAFTTYEKTL